MSNPLPLRPSLSHTPRPRSALDLSSDASADALDALSSSTARTILAALGEEPATASDLAARLDTTVQNVQYHLSKLCDARLVTEAGTWYSTKGREMTVYAPTCVRLELHLADAPEDGVDVSADAAERPAAETPDAEAGERRDPPRCPPVSPSE